MTTRKSVQVAQWAMVIGVFLLAGGVFSIDLLKEHVMDSNRFDEGIIVYDVTYPDISDNHLLKPFLPRKMELCIKGNAARYETKAGIGLFHTGYVLDNRKEKFSPFLKLINVKYFTSLEKEELDSVLTEVPGFDIIKEKNPFTFQGYPCITGVIKYDNNLPSSNIVWTKDLYCENLNWHSQYKNIEGILLEYDIFRSGIRMHLKAVKIERIDIPKKTFGFTKDFVRLNKDDFLTEMDQTFAALH